MNIEEKFTKGSLLNTYQRVDPEYQVDIYLGYNDDGQMSMVITEFGKQEKVKSSKQITASLRLRSDKKLSLSFDLQDDAYQSMFMLFCKDIVSCCEKVGPQMAISSAIKRWNFWKDMFGRKKGNLLDKHEVKGLIAELYELREVMMKEHSITDAIQSWMGPLLGHKDFEIDNTWYEVKCINENALQVTISSIEQLESDVDGHLVLIRLEETSMVSNLSISLNKMVMEISEMITDLEDLHLFQSRLDSIGYTPDIEYDNYNFIFKGRQSYCVDSNFPRLRRCELHNSIGNVKYTLMIDGIVEYKED